MDDEGNYVQIIKDAPCNRGGWLGIYLANIAILVVDTNQSHEMYPIKYLNNTK